MTNKFILGGVIVAIILSISAFVKSSPTARNFIGAVAGTLLAENYIPYINYNDGYYSENAITLTGADGDVTTGDDLTVADDLTVTTTNAATSTASLGCVQTTATSTATAVKLVIGAVNTTASSSFNTITNQGFVNWAYGSCP